MVALGNVHIFKQLEKLLFPPLFFRKFDQNMSDILMRGFCHIGKGRYAGCGEQ